MDKKWRPSQRDGAKPYKKGRGFRGNRVVIPPSPSTAAEDLAEYVLRVLGRDPEAVRINKEVISPAFIKLQVNTDPEVTGRLIGKGGRTITALRLIVKQAAQQRGKRVDIEVS